MESKSNCSYSGRKYGNFINKGRKCDVYYRKEDTVIEYESFADGKNELSISRICSELIVDLTKEA